MKTRKVIPQFQPFLGVEELASIKETLESNWISEGKKTSEFVEDFLNLIGVRYGVMAPNGTLSIFMALRALGVGHGDEVIVPNFTFIASANAVELTGARPVFCDINYELSLDITKAEKLINKRTKAILPVHLYGMSSNMDEILELASLYGISVIEDAAQGVGVKWDGRHTGSMGTVSSFSFFADKTITMGEGGFVATGDESIFRSLQFVRNQGRLNRGSFVHPEIGYNFRVTDLQSSIGLAQLQKLNQIVVEKKRILEMYKTYLDSKVTVIEPSIKSKSNHVPFRVCILTEVEASKLHAFLKNSYIEPRTFFYPLNLQPCYKDIARNRLGIFSKKSNPFAVSIDLFERGTCLPSWVGIPEDDIRYICEKVNEFLS